MHEDTTYIQPLWPKGKPFLRFTGAAANQRHEGAPASSAATPSWPAPACASQPLYHSSGIGRRCANSAPGSSQRSARGALASRCTRCVYNSGSKVAPRTAMHQSMSTHNAHALCQQALP